MFQRRWIDMAFFNKFPLVTYDVNKDGTQKLAIDVLRRIVFRGDMKDQTSLFKEYTVEDGETPEMVAHKFYSSSNLHWIILLMNEIIDPYFQWPMSEASLDDFIAKKYSGKAYYLGNDTNLFFNKNEEVYVHGSGGNTGKRFKDRRGLVESYDPSTKKLVLYNINGNDMVVTDILKGKDSGTEGTVTRIVQEHPQSLHHFEDASTEYLGTKLDPLATPPSGGLQVAVGLTGNAWAGGGAGVTFGNTILHSYTNSLDASVTTHTVVTNDEYERAKNESLRSIKILRGDFVTKVVEDFDRVIKQ